MLTKIVKYAVKQTNPCNKCIVHPVCNIPRKGTLMAKNKCIPYDKFVQRKEKCLELIASAITFTLAAGFFITFIYLVVTFIMGIVYQSKLLFN